MPRSKERKTEERENRLLDAIKHYQSDEKPSIRLTAERYGVPFSTLRGRLQGAQRRGIGHRALQLLTIYEENSIVEWCERMDEWGHPPRLELVRAMAEALIQRRINHRTLGKHWLKRFLSRHPTLAMRISTRLDKQRAFANNPAIIKDYFQKVC
jgi:hypothetical protein